MSNNIRQVNTALIRHALKAIDLLETEVADLRAASTEPVAIVGMNNRFPGGADTPEAFWELLQHRKDAISETPLSRWNRAAVYDPDVNAPGKIYSTKGGFIDNVDQFDAGFFNISPIEAMMMDPQQRITLEASWHALEDAGIPADSLAKTRTGVFVGMGQNDYAFLTTRQLGDHNVNAYYGLGNGHCFTPGRISYLLGLHGPSFAVDTACSSALLAVHIACQSLRNRECEVALAGGVQLMLSPVMGIYLSRTRALSPSGYCRSFSADADGFVRAEGVGMIVLKRLRDAQRDGDRILSVIKGSVVNHDGNSSGITVPNGLAQQQLLQEALAVAGVHPDQLAYIEAHGTGTVLGDPIELDALDTVYAAARSTNTPLWVGAVKSNIGHLEAAAGIAGLIKTTLSLQHALIPANLHFSAPNPQFDWNSSALRVPVENVPVSLENTPIAGVSSFGLSGTNVHMLLEAPVAVTRAEKIGFPFHIITLSAKEPPALLKRIRDLQEFIDRNPETTIEDIAWTANGGRQHFNQRIAWIVNGKENLLTALATINNESDIHTHNETFLQQHPAGEIISRLVAEQLPFAGWATHIAGIGWETALQELAAIYLSGERIPWHKLYQDCNYNKIALPLMPFNRQRYWVDMLPGVEKTVAITPEIPVLPERKDPEKTAYDYSWLKQALPATKRLLNNGEWLVLIDEPEEKEHWQEVLAEQTVWFVQFARKREATVDGYIVDPDKEEDWQWLSAELVSSEQPLNIVYAATLSGYAAKRKGISAPALAVTATAVLLKLAQQFTRTIYSRQTSLYIVTRDALAVTATDKLEGWQQSGIIGFSKSLSLEMPAMMSGVLDIPASLDAEQWKDVISTWLSSAAEPLQAYRDNTWWVPRLTPFKGAELPEDIQIDPDGAYLVTGGTGYLGIKAVKWLLSKGVEKIFVTSRNGWSGDNNPFFEPGTTDTSAVIWIKADISEAAEVDFLLAEIKRLSEDKRLAGIVHGAGSAGFAEATHISREALTAVIASKVYGTWWLYERLQDTPLDFVIGFSSISSAWGSHGQTHYSTANQFLDAILHFWNRKGQRALSVHWGPWSGGGMAGAEDIEMLGKRGINAFPPEQTMDILELFLRHGNVQPVVVDANWTVFAPLLSMLGHGHLFESLVTQHTPGGRQQGSVQTGFSQLRADIQAMPVIQGEQVLLQFLKEQVGEILAYQNGQLPDSRQGLFEMGMDSMSVIQLKERIETQLQIAVQVTDIFEYRTIEQLCSYLLEMICEPQQQSVTANDGVNNTTAIDNYGQPDGSLPVDALLEKLFTHIKTLEEYAN